MYETMCYLLSDVGTSRFVLRQRFKIFLFHRNTKRFRCCFVSFRLYMYLSVEAPPMDKSSACLDC